MEAKKLYPQTTSDKVVNVSDITLPKDVNLNYKKDSLSTVLENIKKQYSTKETTSDDKYKDVYSPNGHISVGGISANLDYSDGKTALEILKDILCPVVYPVVAGNLNASVSLTLAPTEVIYTGQGYRKTIIGHLTVNTVPVLYSELPGKTGYSNFMNMGSWSRHFYIGQPFLLAVGNPTASYTKDIDKVWEVNFGTKFSFNGTDDYDNKLYNSNGEQVTNALRITDSTDKPNLSLLTTPPTETNPYIDILGKTKEVNWNSGNITVRTEYIPAAIVEGKENKWYALYRGYNTFSGQNRKLYTTENKDGHLSNIYLIPTAGCFEELYALTSAGKPYIYVLDTQELGLNYAPVVNVCSNSTIDDNAHTISASVDPALTLSPKDSYIYVKFNKLNGEEVSSISVSKNSKIDFVEKIALSPTVKTQPEEGYLRYRKYELDKERTNNFFVKIGFKKL